jgi:O-antigen/teichoic acid export membrane protein
VTDVLPELHPTTGPGTSRLAEAARPRGAGGTVRSARYQAKGGLSRLKRAGDLWYIIAAAVVNVGNFAFFASVGHLLGPAAYGAVAALLNVVSIVSIPLNAVQAAVVQEVVRQSHDGIAPTVRRAGIAFLAFGLVTTAALAAGSPLAASFLGISSVVPVLLLALWLAPSVVSSLFDGALIGTLRWRPIAVSLIAGAVVRVAFAVVAGLVDPGVDGPVVATVLNALTTLGVVLWAFRDRGDRPVRPPLRLPVRTVATTVLALTGYSVLVAADTLLARHTFAPTVSGNYAAAVTIGRIALFLPMAVTVVVFPRFVSHEGRGARSRRMLMTGLVGVLSVGLGAAGVLALGRHIFVAVLFGQRYVEAARLVGILGVEGAVLGAVGLLTYFHLSRRSLFWASPGAAAAALAPIVLWARPGPVDLARLMAVASTIVLAVMTAAALTGHGRGALRT